MNYYKINEDFLDDQQLDVVTDMPDMRPDVLFDGTFKYPYVFRFIVNKKFFKDSHEEYIYSLNRFFDVLHDMFERCPYIRDFDRFRVVNTISVYNTTPTEEIIESGLQFTAQKQPAPLNTPWFNTEISFDCKDDIVGIIRVVNHLYRSLSIAVKQAFGKVKSYTVNYKTDINKDYQYPGSIQISSMKNEAEHRRAWQSIASMNIESYYSGDLSPLLDAVLAFFPTNSESLVKKYQKIILKMFHKNYDITWYVTQRDNTGITKIVAMEPY